jgi:hypothetical protein
MSEIGNIQNRAVDNISNDEINNIQNVVNQENTDSISPEAKQKAQETRELLEDIYYNYKQIPNPSTEVKNRMDEIQNRLRNLNGECVSLTEKELDHLVNIKDNFADTTFKKMLTDMDECTDYESVDNQAQAINHKLEQAYKGGIISTAELAGFIQTTVDQTNSTKSRIEMLEIKDQEGKLEKCEDQQDYANGLEDLRTLIAGAKFIDFHTKSEMIEHISDTLTSVAKKTKPSPKTRKFMEEMEKHKLEQQERMNKLKTEIADNKKAENIRENAVINEKKNEVIEEKVNNDVQKLLEV